PWQERQMRLASVSDEDDKSCLLLVVVRMKPAFPSIKEGGRSDDIFSVRSPVVAVGDREKDRVRGNESPGKDVRRMLMVCGGMVANFNPSVSNPDLWFEIRKTEDGRDTEGS